MFRDRRSAGIRLGSELRERDVRADVVIGLPRGGVVVAAEVALALGAPLDVIVVRKLGTPGQRELAMGAIGENDVRVLHQEVIRLTGVDAEVIAEVERAQRDELQRRVARIRAHHPRVDLRDAHVVMVDDGVATGSTMRAACEVARAQGAAHITVAVPVAPPDWLADMGGAADDYVALETPAWFMAVGSAYEQFGEVTDNDVERVLRQPTGELIVPDDARGVVLFAHGSGSSHRSPRNRHVAEMLRHRHFGTVLVDLLSPEEEADRRNVFDIDLLGERLGEMIEWVHHRPDCAHLPLSLFGASTGAAAALRASIDTGVSAVVSRGGRPDLAGDALEHVTAPTLLIVGGLDTVVVELNREAAANLHTEHELAIVPGATHLFEEPGTLDEVAVLAADWFARFAAR